jgi:hypothetical protein
MRWCETQMQEEEEEARFILDISCHTKCDNDGILLDAKIALTRIVPLNPAGAR